jgi:hypothetical protein
MYKSERKICLYFRFLVSHNISLSVYTCSKCKITILSEHILCIIFTIKILLQYFVVAPYINNIKNFIVQLMHTNYKILRLLK